MRSLTAWFKIAKRLLYKLYISYTGDRGSHVRGSHVRGFKWRIPKLERHIVL